MGRPKATGETKSHQQHVLMTPSEVAAIDDFRFRNRIGSRGDAIRRLCQLGITLSEEMIPALDQSEALMDDAYAALSIVSQVNRSEHYNKEQADQVVYAQIDKLCDETYKLYVDIMEMHNITQRAVQAGSFAMAMIAVRRERESMDKMRRDFVDYLSRQTERDKQGEENARLMIAFSKLTPEQREAYDALNDVGQELFIEEMLRNAEPAPSVPS